MPRAPMSPESLLGVSRRCAAAISQGGPGVHTAALVSASGLSERTFFRYFPTKADCLRPLMDDGILRFVALAARYVTERHDLELVHIVANAFATAYDEGSLELDRELMSVVLATPAYRRVWLETQESAARLLANPIAMALDLPATHIDVRVAAGQASLLAITAIQEMVESGAAAPVAARAVAHSLALHPISRHPRAGISERTQ